MSVRRLALLAGGLAVLAFLAVRTGPGVAYTLVNMIRTTAPEARLSCPDAGTWTLEDFTVEAPEGGDEVARAPAEACALDVIVRQGQPKVKKGYRSELRTQAVPYGAPVSYCFTTRLNEAWSVGDPPVTLAQWHAVPDRPLGEPGRSPPLRLVVDRGVYEVVFNSDPRLLTRKPEDLDLRGWTTPYAAPVVWGQDERWCFDVTWKRGGLGVLRVAHNDRVVVLHRGALGYNDLVAPFFKIGVYVPGADAAPGGAWRARFSDVAVGPSTFTPQAEP